jgi:hypothetical protein
MKTRYTVTALIFCAALGAPAANTSLGFLTTDGSFQLDQSKIWGTATLFEGSVVETKVAHCRVHLSNGSEIDIAADSRARFFQGRAVVEKGAVELKASAGYTVEARGFRIAAEDAGTVAAVRFDGTSGVAASAAKGRILVASADGKALADVPTGKAVTLTPEIGVNTGLTKLSGCIQSSKSLFVLTDQASNITFVIQGKDVATQAGNRVSVTGTATKSASAVKGVPQVIEVSEITVAEKGACKVSAAKKGAIAGVVSGISAKTVALGAAVAAKPVAAAVIGGVVVAGSVGGVAVANAINSADQPASTSR